MSNVDLHTHSTASDGSDTPSCLVEKAASLGLGAIALCDHDTTCGLEEFSSSAKSIGIPAVPGIEITTYLYKKELHVLGYFIDPENAELKKALADLRNSRRDRNREIIERLRIAGYMVTLEDAERLACGESVGRPHVAMALVEKGYFPNVRAAFDGGLKNGGRFSLPRRTFTPEQTISIIHGAGGVAVWAHPLSRAKSGERQVFRKLLKLLIPFGLDGVEAYYSQFNLRQREFVLRTAQEYNIICTGGSDYHGTGIPSIALGSGEGDLAVPYSVYEDLCAKAGRQAL